MKRLTGLFFLLIGFSASAQQDPLFSQYMFNKLVLNPAYAGSRQGLAVDLLDRYQWVGIDGAPRTITLGAHMATRNERIGLGFYAYRDAAGPELNQGMMLTYAYRIQLAKGTLSLGVQAGFKMYDVDWQTFIVDEPDYSFNAQDIQKIIPDANVGIYYQSNRFFAGLSSKQLLQNEYGKTTSGDKTTYSRLVRHFYGVTGAAFPVSDKLVFRPSVLVRFVKNSPLQADVNASLLFSDVFWIGMSYRSEKAMVFLTEFRLSPELRLGYSYDIYLGDLLPRNQGSHELRLGIDFDIFHSRMKTPRYF